ncbi:GrdB-related putative oxidoreductase [Calorimonas adulescens]|uniref:Glycine/betaine/sarcosine/D-proline reductase family selenoprotein B n=1 Tax=Calorimonas adulescens TaxID=2606906 RepID=A0A5D8QEV6_9THEO|nr:glycine/betaine/sarcosine/D-proline reductase family selenoprotein B [Calorimonas adulescens]
MKIVTIYDQIQSGMGTKDDKMLPLGGKNVPIGPGIMMTPFLKQIDAKIVACLYCGTGTYLNNKEMVSKKLCDMVQKLHPDVVICGPAFDYKDYAQMCAEITESINDSTDIPAIASMSAENEEIINKYKDRIYIVKCPKKGEAGLNSALQNLCQAAKALAVHDKNIANIKEYCF